MVNESLQNHRVYFFSSSFSVTGNSPESMELSGKTLGTHYTFLELIDRQRRAWNHGKDCDVNFGNEGYCLKENRTMKDVVIHATAARNNSYTARSMNNFMVVFDDRMNDSAYSRTVMIVKHSAGVYDIYPGVDHTANKWATGEIMGGADETLRDENLVHPMTIRFKILWNKP